MLGEFGEFSANSGEHGSSSGSSNPQNVGGVGNQISPDYGFKQLPLPWGQSRVVEICYRDRALWLLWGSYPCYAALDFSVQWLLGIWEGLLFGLSPIAGAENGFHHQSPHFRLEFLSYIFNRPGGFRVTGVKQASRHLQVLHGQGEGSPSLLYQLPFYTGMVNISQRLQGLPD